MKKNVILYYKFEKIKEVIKKRGFKTKILAENIGISYQGLRNILDGEVGYTLKNYSRMIHLANLIGLELSELSDFERFKKDSKEFDEEIK